ncbi:TIGR00730 family Rossman fold protein [Pseudorhodoferax sp. Leaf267]|uniref:LOG family protein n=1 Tax=Pseudorhodoferax sp. Leaf267 TaxID=1736316 RepID=UPI00070027DA|nr:TIGR00730 family Rossman fold protein [Pseudorhodoferax sp. Leaf267]KQP18211.1 3-isopropylmalate dehydrogenase [Pseudorhodoferax sp. Leaf267]
MENTDTLDKLNVNVADAWAQLQAYADKGEPLQADAYRLAFADPEFLLRRETRGIRFQLEMLKPDLEQQALGIHNTIVVFGSARFPAPEQAELELKAARDSGDEAALRIAERRTRNAVYYDGARRFATLVARYSAARTEAERLYICTGGGPGIMEAANRGAHEEGALNVGLNIALPHEQSGNRFITPSLSFKFHYFALRKMHFMMRAKALVAFPGGFGTLDELFEVMTLVQTGKAKAVPIVLFGSDYWKRLLNFDVLIEEGAISPHDMALFSYVDTPEDAWAAIQAFYQL